MWLSLWVYWFWVLRGEIFLDIFFLTCENLGKEEERIAQKSYPNLRRIFQVRGCWDLLTFTNEPSLIYLGYTSILFRQCLQRRTKFSRRDVCDSHYRGKTLDLFSKILFMFFSLDLSKFYDLGWPRRARARVAGATGGAGGCFSELAEAHFVMSSIWANFHRSIRPRVDIGWGKFLRLWESFSQSYRQNGNEGYHMNSMTSWPMSWLYVLPLLGLRYL